MVIVGIDEVGRGCWAGPLVAGAVLLQAPVEGLTDSKLLSKRRREQLSAEIIAAQNPYGLGWVTAAEIDQLGLTASVRLAMERALAQMSGPYDEVIIDGNYNFLAHLPQTQTVIKADLTVPAVSAASIIAKVARDQYMAQLDERYSKYEFCRHVGYGTRRHHELLMKYGPSDLHRISFKPVHALLK